MRARTGSAVFRDGRWYARVTLHREPKRGDRYPRHEEVVERADGKAVSEAFARAYAARLQGRYDEGTWQPRRATVAAPVTTVGAWVSAWLDRQTYREVAKDRGRVKVYLDGTALADRSLPHVTTRYVTSATMAVEWQRDQSPDRRPRAAPPLDLARRGRGCARRASPPTRRRRAAPHEPRVARRHPRGAGTHSATPAR